MKVLPPFLGVLGPTEWGEDEHRNQCSRISLFPPLLTLHTAVRRLGAENKDTNLEQKYLLLNSATHLLAWPEHAGTVKESAKDIFFDYSLKEKEKRKVIALDSFGQSDWHLYFPQTNFITSAYRFHNNL